ncbi:MAG: electron transport complex subunit RsxC [bacterium]|nr:electron transport complex subunit RsxC [bacterium]
MSLTFPGGIHPPKNKDLTRDKAIKTIPFPPKVIIPLIQHIGAPANVCVKVGDEVKTGQVVGEANGFVSVPVHASISGKVVEIANKPHPVKGECMSVIIESDGEDNWIERHVSGNGWEDFPIDKIKNKIKDAGICGMGGATFPTHVKLSPPKEKKIDTIIINGAECEPYLSADHRVMLEDVNSVIMGLKIIMKVLGAKKAYIGIEDDKEDALSIMHSAVVRESNMEVVALKAKYPQGAEKQLIKVILNREVPSGGLPMDVGVIVHNVGTAVAIANAIVNGQPLIDRVVCVSGEGIARSANLKVRIGTLFSDVINECGGFRGDVAKIINGGPMMGLAQYTTEVPVIKGTSGILILSTDEVKVESANVCIRCGMCLEACPMYLVPSKLGSLIENNCIKEAKEEGVLDCVECGSCAYTCPSKRPLIHYIKYAKLQISKEKK